MTKETPTEADVQDRLWKAIADSHSGMLGVSGDENHFQPMTAFVERDGGRIWFFTYRTSDLAQAIAGGVEGAFIFQGKDVHASVGGSLTLRHDAERIDRYWNVHVAAWYPEGKDGPRLTLICLEVENAAVWISEAGPLKYAFEVAKANMTKTTPDLGAHRELNLQ